MYRIDSSLEPDTDIINIRIYYNKIIIAKKRLELNFTASNKPTFVTSGYDYNNYDFNQFIQSIEDNSSNIYSFDDHDRFDGFEYINDEQSYLVLKIENELTNISVIMEISSLESKQGIIADLKLLY